MFDLKRKRHARKGNAGNRAQRLGQYASRIAWAGAATVACFLVLLSVAPAAAQRQIPAPPAKPSSQNAPQPARVPPRVLEAQRFLKERGWTPGQRLTPRAGDMRRLGATSPRSSTSPAASGVPGIAQTVSSSTWQPLGPTAVQSPNFGLVTGRVSALALDPSDATGNRLYAGTTGGGVWVANNAAASTPSSIRLYSSH